MSVQVSTVLLLSSDQRNNSQSWLYSKYSASTSAWAAATTLSRSQQFFNDANRLSLLLNQWNAVCCWFDGKSVLTESGYQEIVQVALKNRSVSERALLRRYNETIATSLLIYSLVPQDNQRKTKNGRVVFVSNTATPLSLSLSIFIRCFHLFSFRLELWELMEL